MRRREKFVISSVLLSIGLLLVQWTALDYRYLAVGVFTLVSYLFSTWALSDDLQFHERLTIVPLPAMYSLATSLFYYLLPDSILSQVAILVLFGIGMYALYLTSNIFSVAKGRTIQLMHAAHAVGLLFTLITSLLLSNTIFSLRLPFYFTVLLIGLAHFPLIFMSLWVVRLENEVSERISVLAGVLTVGVMEITLALMFVPLSVWYNSLFVMSTLYIGLGIFHNHLKGRLFDRTMKEYALVATFVAVIYLFVFPLK